MVDDCSVIDKGTTGTSDTETQEDGDNSSGGDAGRETEDMKEQQILRFLDDGYDGHRHIMAKYGVVVRKE